MATFIIAALAASTLAALSVLSPIRSHQHGVLQTPAKRGQITLYPLTFGDPVPAGIAAGPDGAMWFADLGNSEIGRITLDGTITEFPDDLNGPNGIVAGPDGALWFTETSAGQIGRITTDGTITHYGNEFQRYPQSITSGPDGALWFTEFARIGRITTAGSIKHFKAGAKRTEFEGITTGPDGALWFTQYLVKAVHCGNEVIRLTTAGTQTRYKVGSASGPAFITTGSDGALWFTESCAGKIGRLTTGGKLREFSLKGGLLPMGIAAGPDGALWFTAAKSGGGYIGRITTSGHITLYLIPSTGSAAPQQIAAGPDGNMWFTCEFPFAIGRITTH